MIPMNKFVAGINQYINTELAPKLPAGKRIALGIYTGMAMDKIHDKLMELKDHPAVAMIDLIDDNGNVAAEELHEHAMMVIGPGEKFSMDVPLIGTFTFDRNDVERLYQMILKA